DMTVAWRVLFPLCAFGFLKEFRPSESFVTQYLVGPDKNFTKSQVNQDIYPVGTYSNLSLLVLVFLITDWARYKPVIVLEGIAGVATYCLIIWGQDIPTIQIAEFFYGLFMATEVAYLTYIYAMCDRQDFQKVSGYVRSGILLGRFVSGVVSQLTIDLNVLSYHQLNFLTLSGVSFSIVAAILLPSVKKSLYFHRQHVPQSESNPACEGSTSSLQTENQEMNYFPATSFTEVNLQQQVSQSDDNQLNSVFYTSSKLIIVSALKAMKHDFLEAYTNNHVLKWSIWWALATCGYLQVTSYIQMLWQVSAEREKVKLLNGVVDAVYTFLGSLSTWYVGRHKMNLVHHTYLILSICCFLQGTLLLVSVGIARLWVQYVLYILFKILYHSTMVLASSEVAMSLEAESHALIFGFNMFLALCFQSVFTLVVAAKGGLQLQIQNQFYVYGSFFIVLGIGFTLSLCLQRTRIFISRLKCGKTNPSELP
ncbi:Thiamine transporter 2, partial [Frankliniella fusca]